MKTAPGLLLSLFVTGIGIVGANALPAPTDVNATDGTYSNLVRISWSASTGATSYQVLRYPDGYLGPLIQIGTSTVTTCDDTTATSGIIYRYWVQATEGTNVSDLSPACSDTGYYGTPPPIIGPVIKANGYIDNLTINSLDNLSITVQFDPGEYVGTPVDWWVVAYDGGSSWYYLDSATGWTPEDNRDNWHPVHQGPLFNLPAMEVLNITGWPVGSYTFYFAVDYPMDGGLTYSYATWSDFVNVIVQ